MPIVRRKLKYEYRFTQIPNDWLRDPKLSLRSKGLLAQLLSHSEGWNVTISSLAKANNCGKDSIRSSVKELEDSGYLKREQSRGNGGEFAEVLWVTSEPSSPLAGSPSSGLPAPVNPIHKNTKEKNTIVKTNYGDALLDEAFETFWSSYPRKVGKANARKVFGKFAVEHLKDMLDGVIRLAKDPNLPETQFIPYPATWIGREGWQDEAYPKREVKPKDRVAEIPDARAWVKAMHDMGEHWECREGEFGCK